LVELSAGGRASRDVGPPRVGRALHRPPLLRAEDAILLDPCAAGATAPGEAAHVAEPRLVALGDVTGTRAVADLRAHAECQRELHSGPGAVRLHLVDSQVARVAKNDLVVVLPVALGADVAARELLVRRLLGIGGILRSGLARLARLRWQERLGEGHAGGRRCAGARAPWAPSTAPQEAKRRPPWQTAVVFRAS